MTTTLRWLAAILVLGAARPALAADVPVWDVALGGGPLVTWAYPGAATMVVRPIPYVSIDYKDIVEFDSLDGLRINAIRRGGFTAGFAGQYRWGRDTRDMPGFQRGLGKVYDTIELGGFAAYEWGPLSIDALLTRDVLGVHDGVVFESHADLSIPLGDPALQQGFQIGPFVEVTSGSYARKFFGVSATQSATSGLPTYRASGGLDQVGIQISGNMNLTRQWWLRGFASYGWLQGDAAGSTIVRDGGSREQIAGGVFLVYTPKLP